MFSFFRKLFKKREPKPPHNLPGHQNRPQPSAARSASGKPAAAQPGGAEEGTSPKAKEEWARQAAQKINPHATPEELCGITDGMSKEEISAQLATLYRRHNRAASSLEASLREEAEIMLDVIATLRQKYGG